MRTSRPSRKYVPLIAAIGLAVMMVAAAVTAMNLGPTTDSRNLANSAPSTVRSDGVTPVPSRTETEPASRSGLRHMPSTSPSASPSRPSPTAKRSTSGTGSGSGTVVSSGTCGASYYTTGTTTANGEPFDTNALTAAHKTLPFNTKVKVTNPATGKSVTVRINDRGPFVDGRCLDLTRAAFETIADLGAGVITVNYQVLG